MEIAEILKVLGDETNLKILSLLEVKSLCVCEIERILEIKQSNASKHLNKLKKIGVIEMHKQAQWVYYELSKNFMMQHPFIKELFKSELKDLPSIIEVLERFERYRESCHSCEDLRKHSLDKLV